jgi:acetyl esterase
MDAFSASWRWTPRLLLAVWTYTILVEWSADSATRIDEGVVMNKAIRTMAVITLILSIGVIQSCSGVVLAGESEQKPQYVYKMVGNRELKTDILYPDDWKSTDRRAAIVFFSGGAWRSGDTRQFVRQAGYFAKRGMLTVRAEYRDSTKDKVKPDTCLQDAISAMRWVRKNADRLGIDPGRIVSSGGSAGGYLAAAVATINGYHAPDDDLSVSPKPNAMVLFNPVFDLVTLDLGSRFGLDPELAARISPLQYVDKDLPPTLILIGSKDRFLVQNREFMSKAKELGVRVEIDVAEGQPHAYFNRSPWMEKTVSSADRFLVSLGYLTKEPRVELPSSGEQR